MTMNQITDLKSLDDELAKDSLRGLWMREETMRREPEPFGKPMLWKWAKIRAGLEAAGDLIMTNYKGARRAISLVHPKMGESTSHTLNMAVQLVKAGEAVYSHRHTNAAMRFVIEGGEGIYTITGGEKCVMETGDLVIQPSWGYHNHINETERDAIWIDCTSGANCNQHRHSRFSGRHHQESRHRSLEWSGGRFRVRPVWRGNANHCHRDSGKQRLHPRRWRRHHCCNPKI